MADIRVELVRDADRALLCRMLESSVDFPSELVYLYRRKGSRPLTLVAWLDDEICGVLSGYLDSDLAGNDAFDEFGLPPAPHAFLERIHVDETARCRGAGRDLVARFASKAAERGSTFIAGSLDLSTDDFGRRRFFESVGFDISDGRNFGATVAEVVSRASGRRS